ncbi:flippase [Patescibacteria group bacterium]|nr:flippase [Patescibacteria group bacterium]MBU1683075.1 flippase [Patescibacteria group bacterium]MBU1935164.1 flippase [Patescibacteria group bacterium]
MSIARKILENTFIQVLGKLITAGLSVVVLKIISSYLGTAGYGDYTTVYQFLAFFGIAADFGIYTITVKEMSKDDKKIPMILGNVMGLRTMLAILTMGAAAIAAFLIPSYAGTVIPMGVLIATLATFFTLLNGTVSSVLQVHLKMQFATIGLVLGKIVSVAYMALVAYVLFTGDLVLGFQHLLWAGVLGNLVMFVITSYYVTRFSKITYRFDFGFWKRIFITSLPYGVALVLNTIYFRLDVILLTLMLPHTEVLGSNSNFCPEIMCGNTEVGLYGVAMRFLEMLVIIPIYFMNSVLPVMTRFIEEQSKRIKELMQYSFDFLIATGIPILVGGFILAVPIIMFISDPEFVSGNIYTFGSDLAVRILMFAMLFSFINALFGFTLVVLNKQVKLMFINAGCVLFNLIGNLLVIPTFGFRGAAMTSVFSELFILIFTAWIVKNALGFSLSPKTLFKVIFSSFVMGLAVAAGYYWMTDVWFVWQIALLIPLGGVVYAIMILATKAVTPEMWRLLRKS